jgi:starch phosphorylase
VGSQLRVKALVGLGAVEPTEVVVQLYHGPTPVDGVIEQGQVVPMKCAGSHKDGAWEFSGAVLCTHSGQYGFAVRIIPRHPDLAGQYDLHHIKWA